MLINPTRLLTKLFSLLNHSGELRGGKYSLFEAGTRVPFSTYWEGQIQAGTSSAIVSQIDFLASIASLVGSEEKGLDSENLLDDFLGITNDGREELILEATTRTALRKGDWILIPPHKGPAINTYVNIELGNDDEYQLYNLSEDIGEKKNLAKTNPEKLKEMIASFEQIRGSENRKVEQLELK